jgi:formate-dependent phosphoribosylglycinamide formyltransferase (GAR transformylase)
MAKAKKRVAAHKKSSKRGKASAKSAHKMTAKHATSKKASKVQRVGVSSKKSAAKKTRPPETAKRSQVVAMSDETTIIDVIAESEPGIVAVTEYESVRTATSISPGGEPERGEGTPPAAAST